VPSSRDGVTPRGRRGRVVRIARVTPSAASGLRRQRTWRIRAATSTLPRVATSRVPCCMISCSFAFHLETVYPFVDRSAGLSKRIEESVAALASFALLNQLPRRISVSAKHPDRAGARICKTTVAERVKPSDRCGLQILIHRESIYISERVALRDVTFLFMMVPASGNHLEAQQRLSLRLDH
jgi:hypothetical protein